jgi:hypothetical protein
MSSTLDTRDRRPGGLVRRVAAKLQVESEPGLTTAQMMLTNYDLKPVEVGRRQWGTWNFVGFWIADSFNINTWMIASLSFTPSRSPSLGDSQPIRDGPRPLARSADA